MRRVDEVHKKKEYIYIQNLVLFSIWKTQMEMLSTVSSAWLASFEDDLGLIIINHNNVKMIFNALCHHNHVHMLHLNDQSTSAGV